MKRLFALALLIAGAAVPTVSQGQDYGRPAYGAGRGDDARDDSHVGRQVPLRRVLQGIASRNPGRHLNVSLGDAGGRTAYFVQWQYPDGRVVVFVVDAETGQLLGRQGR